MIRLSYVVTIISVTLLCVLAEELYSDKYDNIDATSILQNNKLLVEYYNCFLEKALCPTEDAKFFQGILSEALQTKCKKCTQKQMGLLLAMKNWYIQNKPEQWEALIAKSVEDMKKKNW
ncbi:PREDICTED: ejaculatory bulb-specific protein 3-like isoform X2 [Trachymyrmex septentrionalis]|uniref:ejaculatory bulb-specific protein 3-like isoform X2 n=1 Tax=Trachymyrmex septentrionalis TaxID=34720 RepID=UPI00084F5EFD|nr:PREDICTED: ejaculatory bulb-specific protein 3-like isoform X2 [Trachymyrmex septentrionalis]